MHCARFEYAREEIEKMIILTTISREWDRRIEKTGGRSHNCGSFVSSHFSTLFLPSRYHDLDTSRRNGLKDGSKNSEAMLVTKVEEKKRKKKERKEEKEECRVRASIFVKARVIYLIYYDERRELVFFFVLSMYIITWYKLSNLHHRHEKRKISKIFSITWLLVNAKLIPNLEFS